MLKSPLSFYLLIAIAPTLASGSGMEAAESDPSFSCVAWGQLPYSEIYYGNDKKLKRIELVSGRRSETYAMKRSESFGIYIKEKQPNGKMRRKLVGKTTFPPGATRMLFIIAQSNKKRGLPLSILGIEDSLDVFPSGTFRFVNFTNAALHINFGNKASNLRPRGIKVIKAKMAPKGGLMSLVIRDKKGTPIFARRLFGQPRSRELVFITPSTTVKGKLSAIVIAEIVPVKKQ